MARCPALTLGSSCHYDTCQKGSPSYRSLWSQRHSWWKFSQSQGLKNPFKVRKDHQGTDRIKWSTACPKAKISGRCHFSLACEYIKSPEVKSRFLFSSHHCSSPRESIRRTLFSDHNQGLSNLSVHENPPGGGYVNGGSGAPPPELQSEVSPQNRYFNKLQVAQDPTFRSLGIEVPQSLWWLALGVTESRKQLLQGVRVSMGANVLSQPSRYSY